MIRQTLFSNEHTIELSVMLILKGKKRLLWCWIHHVTTLKSDNYMYNMDYTQVSDIGPGPSSIYYM